jgi:hypothetical protein
MSLIKGIDLQYRAEGILHDASAEKAPKRKGDAISSGFYRSKSLSGGSVRQRFIFGGDDTSVGVVTFRFRSKDR